MAPTSSISEADNRIYQTRFRKCIQKKYDDIFSSVVQKALSNDPSVLSNSLNNKTLEGHRRKANSISCSRTQRIVWKTRSVSECEGTSFERSSFESDISGDSDSNESSSIMNSNSSSTEEDDNTINNNKKKKCTLFPILCCEKSYSNHQHLHEHLVMEHSPSPLFNCKKCGVNLKALRNQHYCRICNQFAWSMDIHLRSHYQDRTGSGALMECRRCYRSFPTLREVREHEKRVHGPNKGKSMVWVCQYCKMQFGSRHMRDTHLVAHVDQAVGDVWERIDKMQEIMTDQIMVNQCPLCLSVMGSRKSFRLHVIHKHLAQDPHMFLSFLGVNDLKSFNSDFLSKPIKQELTDEEVENNDNSSEKVIKSEPLD